jgi:hypothetical protein
MRSFILLLAAIAIPCLFAAEPTFTSKPAAAKSGTNTVVKFTVSAPTDVEVAVINGKKEVVRHLAAGQLGGKKAPPEPLKAGLTQAIEWDDADDLGKKASGGPFSFRVRMGMGVKLGRFIGGDPYDMGEITSMAADETGNLYIMADSMGGKILRAFDPEGRFVRTLIPFPANLKPNEMKDIASWDADAKAFRPRQMKVLFPEFYSPADYMWKSGNITVISANSKSGLTLTNGSHVFQLDTRGAVPGNGFSVSTLWDPNHPITNSGHGPVFMATSPDGKSIYLAGPHTVNNEYGYTLDPAFPPGRLFRLEVGKGYLQKFADTTVTGEYKPGGGGWWNPHTEAPMNFTIDHGPIHQVAVDLKGNVLLADRDNQCIQIYDPTGKAIGKLAVGYPDLVAVHPKTGEIYVLTKEIKGYWLYQKTLKKFSGWKDGKLLADHDLGPKGHLPQMAVVAGKRTVIWLSGIDAAGGLVSLEDQGSKFAPMKNVFTRSARIGAYVRMAVDPAREEVYVNDGGATVVRYNGETGEVNGSLGAGDVAVGYDGLIYARIAPNSTNGSSFSGPLERLDHDFKPAPYKETGSHVLSPYIYGRMGVGFGDRGIGVGPDGKVYSSWMWPGWVNYCVTGWGSDGKPMKGNYLEGKGSAEVFKNGAPASMTSAIFGPIAQANGGVKVDLKGNIYLGMLAWPKNTPYPKPWDTPGEAAESAYKSSVGSVFKFTPAGGMVANLPSYDKMSILGLPPTPGAKGIETSIGFVEGATEAYPGCGPYSLWGFGGNTCCVCRTPRFDVDRYGRIVMPNAVANCVTVVDNAGNEILTFGKYGNFDSQYVPDGAKDGKPLVDTPEIPLSWPVAAGVSDKAIYVNDYYNRRLVRSDFTWKAEASCPVQ